MDLETIQKISLILTGFNLILLIINIWLTYRSNRNAQTIKLIQDSKIDIDQTVNNIMAYLVIKNEGITPISELNTTTELDTLVQALEEILAKK